MTERVRVYFKSARVCSRLATPPRHALYYCRKRFFFYAHFLSGISLGCVFFFASIFFLPRIFLYIFFFFVTRVSPFLVTIRVSIYIYIYSYTCARRGHREVQHTHVKRIQNTVGKTVRRYDVVFLRHTRLLCTRIRTTSRFGRRETCKQYPKNLVSSATHVFTENVHTVVFLTL